jgi:hypothetical protein
MTANRSVEKPIHVGGWLKTVSENVIPKRLTIKGLAKLENITANMRAIPFTRRDSTKN